MYGPRPFFCTLLPNCSFDGEEKSRSNRSLILPRALLLVARHVLVVFRHRHCFFFGGGAGEKTYHITNRIVTLCLGRILHSCLGFSPHNIRLSDSSPTDPCYPPRVSISKVRQGWQEGLRFRRGKTRNRNSSSDIGGPITLRQKVGGQRRER